MEEPTFFDSAGNEFFSLEGYKCSFEICSDSVGNNILKVTANSDEPIHYAFGSSNGLCLTTPFGSVIKPDLLKALISLPDNNAKAILQYLEETGFFFSISNAGELIIDATQMVELIYRLKATILLMSAISEPRHDYDIILQMTLYLLLSDRINLQLSDRNVYNSCSHSVKTLIDSATIMPITEEDYTEANETGFYSIKDTVYKPSYNLDAEEYDDIVSGDTFSFSYPGIDDHNYRQLTYLYKNYKKEKKSDRYVIDFLFHLMHETAVVKSVSFLSGVSFYSDKKSIILDEEMKGALLITAKLVLANEINYNISKIRPTFNPSKLEPSWKATSLLSAYYFSIYYMHPGKEIYRKCANPSCHEYFSVKTSNSRKIYCCTKCRDANDQREHRIKIKNGTAKKGQPRKK